MPRRRIVTPDLEGCADDGAVHARVEGYVLRRFFDTGLAVSLLAALGIALLATHRPAVLRAELSASCIALALVFAAARAYGRGGRHAIAACAAGWASIAVIAWVGMGLGEGVRAPAFGFFAIVVALVCATSSVAAGAAMAGVCGALLLAFAGAEQAGWLGVATPVGLGVALVTQGLLVVGGLSAGILSARIAREYLDAAAQREQRLGGLLRLACDWYWEMDAQFRFTRLSEEPRRDSGLPASRRLGRAPWEIEHFGIDDATMRAHRADVEAHRSFHGLLVQRRGADGRTRFARVSGEPRFDARGAFVGYWGVGRDASAEVAAERAIASSEARYRELFERTPSPLVLHRCGRVIDANAAALALFGYPSLDALRGQDIGSHYVGEAATQRMRERVARLEAAPIGEGVAAAEFELRSTQGQRLDVLVAGVRVEAAGGPATLSIYFDETERRLAHAALQRSEATLSHLVATSPDLIALTELSTGRFVMVNPSFTRVLGWSANEVIGRTSSEIGSWHRSEDRERLVEAVAAHGKVEAMPLLFRAKGGEPVSMLVSAARFEMEGRAHLVISARDVTASDRTRLEYQAILQSASIGIAFTRAQRFVQVNPHFERMLGWPKGELRGTPASVVWPSDEDYAEVGRIAGPLLGAGKPVELERRIRRRDGSLFWARVMAQVVDPSHPSHGGTIWIAEDVTERRRVEQALATARDAAEAANRAKSAFLANTSHEIRTPLNGLLGLAQLAMREDLDAVRRQQYLRQIHESAQSLTDIISDILDLSKIEAGRLTLETRPFDLRGLLDALSRAYGELAQARGLRLELALEADVPPAVRGDALRVRQILGNYLSNAVKFTRRGAVRLEVERGDADVLRFTVGDSGCGIDAAALARLFQPFTQADESTTRRYGGTGLGLSICRELAELMGGTVGAESEAGAGSRFWAELPLPASTLDAAHEGDAAPAAGDAADLAGARILMVEDTALNMLIAVAQLDQGGARVTQAGDGRAALDAVARAQAAGEPFHAVLMDVQMPVMSGHEAARRLRVRHAAKALPIVAITAAALVSEREAALEAGMNDFLTKPIDPAKLRATLVRAIKAREEDCAIAAR
jgi:PAS domain S-box-containing protein